jgi:hypothetical protein
MPRVFNRRANNVPPGAVYVGRPTKWGNPYKVGPDGDHAEVVRKFRAYICADDLIFEIGELRGKDLVCWCAPAPCHADVLLELANDTSVPIAS